MSSEGPTDESSLQAELTRVKAEARDKVLAARAEVQEANDAAEKMAARNQVLENNLSLLRRSAAEHMENARKRLCEVEYHTGKTEEALRERISALEGSEAGVLGSVVDVIGECYTDIAPGV